MEASIFLCLLVLSSEGYATVSSNHDETTELWRRPAMAKMLFVFGDSYADTGNVRKSMGNSWKEPYGTTFPGKPAGRFSDGRVLTDYLARFLGNKSPFAYTWMKLAGDKKLRNGMNFAYGGSGVFDTYTGLPNMTTQIGFFEKLIKGSVYTKRDLQSSVVLVCLSGNDYAAYLAKGGTSKNVQSFIPQVVNQLVLNLRRIQGLDATRIVVTTLQPIGCLPQMTKTLSFRQCNTTLNMAVGYHNLLLQQAIAKLNDEYLSNNASFVILDLYTSFTTVLERKRDYQGTLFLTFLGIAFEFPRIISIYLS